MSVLHQMQEYTFLNCFVSVDILLVTGMLLTYASIIVTGNSFGEEGCEQLQEILEGFNRAEVLGSLRYDVRKK